MGSFLLTAQVGGTGSLLVGGNAGIEGVRYGLDIVCIFCKRQAT